LRKEEKSASSRHLGVEKARVFTLGPHPTLKIENKNKNKTGDELFIKPNSRLFTRQVKYYRFGLLAKHEKNVHIIRRD